MPKHIRQENITSLYARVDQLDGLRGIAILIVILNHLRLTPLFTIIPQWSDVFLGAFISSGRIAVAILFLLSGYLMATIYPRVSHKLAFYQKRYTRIFPPFLAMCVSLAIIRHFWTFLLWWQMIVIVVGIVAISGLFWRFFQHLKQRPSWGKKIFYSFFCLQFIMLLGYIFVLPHIPPAVFYQIWPIGRREFITFLGNATMTLPFGNYLPQLDGVYWSVITEIGLYLLYPIFFLPILSYLRNKKSAFLSIGALVLCFPFFYGLSLLFKSVLGLGMLNVQLAIYFGFGAAIGLFKDEAWLKKIQTLLIQIPAPLLWLLCFLALIGSPLMESKINFGYEIDSLIWSVPIMLMMLITLARRNVWTKFLSAPWLVRIGQISFSLYLTHTIAIEMFVKKGDPQTVTQMLSVGIPAIIVASILALTLNYFLEQPYLKNKIPKLAIEMKPKKTLVQPVLTNANSVRRPLGIALVALLIIIWAGFHVPTRITTEVDNYRLTSLAPITLITKQPLVLPFTATKQNLGMLLFDIRPATDGELAKLGNVRGGDADQFLIITLFDDQHHQISTNKFPLYQISETRFFSTGLPIITDSAGKEYLVELRLTSDDIVQKIVLLNSNQTFRAVYFLGKGDLLKNPRLIVEMLVGKMFGPFLEPDALKILGWCLPLLLWLALGFQPSSITDIRHRRQQRQ